MVKNLPAKQKTWVTFLGQEDPLEEKMATHSSILAWEISWTEEPAGLQSMGSQRIGHNLSAKTVGHKLIHYTDEKTEAQEEGGAKSQ